MRERLDDILGMLYITKKGKGKKYMTITSLAYMLGRDKDALNRIVNSNKDISKDLKEGLEDLGNKKGLIIAKSKFYNVIIRQNERIIGKLN